jgi:hypothetical protein
MLDLHMPAIKRHQRAQTQKCVLQHVRIFAKSMLCSTIQACLTLVLSAATRLLKSPEDLTAQAYRSDHFLMTVARFCTISTVAAISKTVLGKLNSTTVVDDDRYKNLIQLIKYRYGARHPTILMNQLEM